MAIAYKCKCCAANLDVEEGMRLVKCPACKTKQTLPSSRDENIQNLFNRATILRLKCEFDKAETIYERIIQADEEQYEAYWGLILCKFGVEYVEDPKTETRIPTCHRTSYESIIADENYKLALKYALDDDQKALYRQEAEEIDKIQKGILEVAQNEEPYDVFICYKETDENGKRTQDSVIANDIYHQLTQEGFKVFYSAITLEGKLGSAYEPIIFAALNSAKVMLAVGTKPEYFQAVWVKNEWSRFLKMNKDNRNKLLIPCYKGMDPYDLPDEFAHLQAQDMGKIGFITDLIRGVKKVVNSESGKKGAGSGNVTVQNLLKRAYLFLGDGDFANAKTYCEKALDIDAENSDAYLYELLVSLRSTQKENLAYSTLVFETLPEYKKAYAFGNEEQRRFLEESLKSSKEKRNALAERQREEERREREQRELALIQRIKTGIMNKDFSVESLISEITNEEIRAKLRIALNNARNEVGNSKIYQCAKELKDDGQYEKAIEEFNKILQYKDSAAQVQECKNIIAKIEEQKAENARQRELERKDSEERAKKSQGKKFFLSTILGLLLVVGVFLFMTIELRPFSPIILVLILVIIIIFIADGIKDKKERNYCKLELSENEAYYIVTGVQVDCIKYLIIPNFYKGKPIKEISGFAFRDRYDLERVIIGESVTKIGFAAFSNCGNLTKILIAESVMSIDEHAFASCYNLTGVYIRNIGAWCNIHFAGSWNSNPLNYAKNLYLNSKLVEKIVIPSGVTSIQNKAFVNCSSLKNVIISNSILSIGSEAFHSCDNLTSIEIPSSVTKIDFSAFYNCDNLTIYCEATSQPSGWDENWNSSNRPVEWGYKGE